MNLRTVLGWEEGNTNRVGTEAFSRTPRLSVLKLGPSQPTWDGWSPPWGALSGEFKYGKSWDSALDWNSLDPG